MTVGGRSDRDGRVAELLRVGPGFELDAIDPRQVRIGPADKATARAEAAGLEPRASELQERLWAEAKAGGGRSVLVVFQGIDTAGKGGATKALDRLLDPLGFSVVSFGVPTEEERSHHYLWRHERALPEPGKIRVHDRSHYETVLVERVRELVPEEVWRPRYDEINAWEAGLAERGVTFVKCLLHVSKDEQRERLLARLDDPTKHWKYNPRDLEDRGFWEAYQAAFQEALARCSTEAAPWYVIPADRKWHRDWLVSHLLVEILEGMEPAYPEAGFDVEAERRKVEAS
jgi:PPK2 family polyphosphate:nucleotide phosphotransferase